MWDFVEHFHATKYASEDNEAEGKYMDTRNVKQLQGGRN
jgi:hypothetical protein